MKKTELKDGMILVLRNGNRRLFFKDNLYLMDDKYNLEKAVKICQYTDELTNWNRDWDVMKVYYGENLVWKRHDETDWSNVPFGTKVRGWDEDDNGEREYEVVGKFLGYEENKYGDSSPSLPFLIYYEEHGIDTGWFEYCEIIQEDEENE